jgi:PII-like signaling protein
MDGSLLRFYVHENDRLHGQLAWEWLLQRANALGIRGGTAFRAMAGFGHHRVLHEERFFELAGTVTIELEFIVTDDEARQLLDLVDHEGLRAFYARTPAHFGLTGA